MNKKIIGIIIVFVIIVIGAFIGLTLTSSPSTANTEISADGENGSGKGDKEAAEKLIGENVTQDEVKENVGEWAKFEMNNEGCERGVYAGIFYYNNFIIFSRTYDKGKNYEIVSVN